MEKMLLGDTGNIKGKHKSAHVSMFPDFDFPCNMSDVANLDSARHPAPRTAIFCVATSGRRICNLFAFLLET